MPRPTFILAIIVALAIGFAGGTTTHSVGAQTPDPCIPTVTSTSTNTPTHTPTNTPIPTATPGSVYLPVVIYGDAFGPGWSRQAPAGWTASWGMSSVTEVASPVFEGVKAWRLVYNGGGGFQIMANPTPQSMSGTLVFSLQGAGRVKAYVKHGGGTTQLGTVTATSTWVTHRLVLPASSLAGVTEVTFQEADGQARTVYLDGIGVEGSAPPAASATPTASATATPGPSVTPASTPTAPAPTATATTLPTGSTLRILPLGDSITEGGNGGYRVGLWNRLVNAGYTVNYVGPRVDQYAAIPDQDHAGTPGFNTGNILSNIDGYMATYQPDTVLLMIGTNDLAWWVASSNEPANAAARVGQILDRIQAARPGTRVILATTPPISSDVIPIVNSDRADLIRVYNAALRTLAAARGIRLIDVETALTLADLYDGVHPSQAAHTDKIAPLWFDAITN